MREDRTYRSFDEWKSCDRCGFCTHWSEMVYDDGYWLCTVRDCVDVNEEINEKET